jgi:Ni/Fe-hydrogenase 1 B-type cytochrome subunit
MSPDPDDEVVRVYVWQIPVRVAHWLIALSIVVLAATGIYIGHPFISVPGEARFSFVMGWTKVIHFYAAVVFVTAVVMRVIWMFSGNKYARWDKFLPVHATRRQGLPPTLSFYLFAEDKPPTYVGHNPLAGLTYAVVYLLYAAIILTGLTMYASHAGVTSPLRWFTVLAPVFGGFQSARWIHHVVMWLLLGFAVHHVYSAWLVTIVEKMGTLDSMFAGYKWVPKSALLMGPYRWMHRGEVDE